MEGDHPAGAPVLSTPDARIFEDENSRVDISKLPRLSDEQLYITYEIERTVQELKEGKWKRIALQFPDHLLVDAPRVYQELARGLRRGLRVETTQTTKEATELNTSLNRVVEGVQNASLTSTVDEVEELFILADTSYGACCVDEVAAEHSDSDVVVHYGRSCLSPTARLPVIYVFTKPSLDLDSICQSFSETYQDHNQKIILMADIPFQDYLPEIAKRLKSERYTNIFVTGIVHDVASPLPNRTMPPGTAEDVSVLSDYSLFHVSDPPSSLLLTISSRVSSIYIYPTRNTDAATATTTGLLSTSTSALLRRRYALLTRLTTAPVIGILVNTLSVASYMTILAHLKAMIAAAGKKSYTFVVGKVNAAKVANFAEVGGWVVIGCWESSLFDSSDFWKPVVTPWELELALKQDDERVWTGHWRSDFGALLEIAKGANGGLRASDTTQVTESTSEPRVGEDDISDDESAPPEFDLRTGRYVSHSRPMEPANGRSSTVASNQAGPETVVQTLTKRVNGDLATIGGAVSPAAEFFKNQRSWQGLGSDYAIEYDRDGRMVKQEAAKMEVGRSGIARGYDIGDDHERR